MGETGGQWGYVCWAEVQTGPWTVPSPSWLPNQVPFFPRYNGTKCESMPALPAGTTSAISSNAPQAVVGTRVKMYE